MSKAISQAHPQVRKKDLRVRFKNSIPIYLLILPSTLLILVFHYLPIFGIAIAFQDYSVYKGVFGSTWAGFKYFERFLSDPNYWRVMRNTLIINIYDIIFSFPIPIIFALLLNELRSNKLKRVAQTISYLPHFISWVIVAGIFVTILSPSAGVVNMVIKNVFKAEPVHFLVKPQYFRTILIFAGTWKGFGMSAVYYIAALSSIDTELYAAASIDGAGRLRQTWHITLPGLRLMIVVLLIIKIGGIISIGFEKVFLLYNPMLYDVGDVISTYTYRLGIEKHQYSLTSAIGLTQSAVNFILVYSANRLSRRVVGWSMW
jgi:putative aldouronate transport system permease protein